MASVDPSPDDVLKYTGPTAGISLLYDDVIWTVTNASHANANANGV
jgi:hypothetical protein